MCSQEPELKSSMFPHNEDPGPWEVGQWPGPATHCLRENGSQRPRGREQPGEVQIPGPTETTKSECQGTKLRICLFAMSIRGSQ